MVDGNVNEFIDNLTMQDEMVRYNGHLYYFYGIQYNSRKKVYYARIDRFGESIHQFEEEVYYYESPDISDCLEHLLSDKYWNGKTFYEVQGSMRWVDG